MSHITTKRTNSNETIRLREILGNLEALLVIAQHKGLSLRRPWNVTWDQTSESKNIAARLKALDELKVSWRVQNRILAYINDCDQQSVWNEMYSNSFARLAHRALNHQPAT